MTKDEWEHEARMIGELDPESWDVWLDNPSPGDQREVTLLDRSTEIPTRIGTMTLKAVDTDAGVGFASIAGIQIDRPVTHELIDEAMRHALAAEREDTETRQLVQAIAGGLPAETVAILRDKTDRPRRSEELATVAWVYAVAVDRFGRRDPNEWIKLILGYKSTRSAQRRVAEARARGLITAPAERGRTTRSTTTKGKKK